MKTSDLHRQPRVAVRRVSPGRVDPEKSSAKLRQVVASSLKDVLQLDVPIALDQRRELQTRERFVETASYLNQLLGTGLVGTLEHHINWNGLLLSPPYDHGWAEGAGDPVAHWNGKPIVLAMDGFSASGFSIELETDEVGLVACTPVGTYQATWGTALAAPGMRSSAGAGVAVYRDGQLVKSHQPRLWDVSGPGQGHHLAYSGRFADIATPVVVGPEQFGPVPLAPVLTEIAPGQRLEVWFYLWHLGQNVPRESGFMTAMSADIPMVSVTFGKPPRVN